MQDIRKWWVLVASGLAGLLVAVDFTIVNTCLPRIQAEFHATDHSLQWIITGFGISFCALMTPCGRLADLIGRRKVFYGATIGFLLASLGAGLSQSMNMLIVMRFLQGALGAPVFPASIAIATAIFPEEEHSRALGILGSLTGVGLGIGPVLGGLIASSLSWRWIFFINVPILFISLIMAYATMPESRLEQEQHIDWWGSLFLILFLSGLLVYVNEGAILGWISAELLGFLALAVVALIAFLVVEQRVAEPLIVYRYFKNRYFIQGLMQYIGSISTCWAVAFLIPLYLSKVLGYTVAKIGWVMAIMTVLTIVAPTVTGYMLERYNQNRILHASFVLSILGLFALAMLGVDPSFLMIVVSFVIFGWAWGMGNILPANIALRANVAHAGMYTGALFTLGNVVGVVLLTFSSTWLWHQNRVGLINDMRHSDLHLSSDQLSTIAGLTNTPVKLQRYLDQSIGTVHHAQVSRLIHQALASGFMYSFLLLLLIALLAWLVVIATGLRRAPS